MLHFFITSSIESSLYHHHHVVPPAQISLTLSRHFSYHSSPLAGLQGYILCPHIAAVCKFALIVLLLLGHMWGSIRVHRLWARPCFSSSVPACLVRLTCIVFMMGGKWPYSWCLVGCCRQDLFNIRTTILEILYLMAYFKISLWLYEIGLSGMLMFYLDTTVYQY